jgi:hypothetical protein
LFYFWQTFSPSSKTPRQSVGGLNLFVEEYKEFESSSANSGWVTILKNDWTSSLIFGGKPSI